MKEANASPALDPGDPAVPRLLEAAGELASARDLARVADVVRRAARKMVRADGVTFVLREGEFVHYVDEDAISPLWKGRRFPVGACISGWAMTHARSVAIEDIEADPRIPLELYRSTFVRSLLMVPVGGTDPVAAIGAYWADHHAATIREERLLAALAGLAGPALANAALEKELRVALAARDELIVAASHELRTPLAAVRLRLDSGIRLIRRGAGPERLRQSLEAMDGGLRRLSRLVDDLLDASRLRQPLALEREELDLAALAEAVAARFRRDGAVIRISASGPVVGRWDPPRVTRILESLLSNAVKFGGGRPVDVEVRGGQTYARVDVRDRGDGIPPAAVERIFGAFERAADLRHHGGLGLGLWIARLCAEAHGGTLTVKSLPHEGSTFTLALPSSVPRHVEPRQAGVAAAEPLA